MSQYFLEPSKRSGGNVKFELHLSNYATKSDLEWATGVDTSLLALKADLASLKSQLDKLDVDKPKSVSVDLSKLSNVVGNAIAKNTVYGKFVPKFSTISSKISSISELVSKTHYDLDKQDIQKN